MFAKVGGGRNKRLLGGKAISFAEVNQWCLPKTVTGGLCCRKCMDQPLITPILCIYGNDVLVKPVYVKVLKEGDGKYRVVTFSFY